MKDIPAIEDDDPSACGRRIRKCVEVLAATGMTFKQRNIIQQLVDHIEKNPNPALFLLARRCEEILNTK